MTKSEEPCCYLKRKIEYLGITYRISEMGYMSFVSPMETKSFACSSSLMAILLWRFSTAIRNRLRKRLNAKLKRQLYWRRNIRMKKTNQRRLCVASGTWTYHPLAEKKLWRIKTALKRKRKRLSFFPFLFLFFLKHFVLLQPSIGFSTGLHPKDEPQRRCRYDFWG